VCKNTRKFVFGTSTFNRATVKHVTFFLFFWNLYFIERLTWSETLKVRKLKTKKYPKFREPNPCEPTNSGIERATRNPVLFRKLTEKEK